MNNMTLYNKFIPCFKTRIFDQSFDGTWKVKKGNFLLEYDLPMFDTWEEAKEEASKWATTTKYPLSEFVILNASQVEHLLIPTYDNGNIIHSQEGYRVDVGKHCTIHQL